jgi:hypothetical protein
MTRQESRRYGRSDGIGHACCERSQRRAPTWLSPTAADDGAQETVAAVEAKGRKAMMLIVQQTDTSGIIGTFMLVRRRRAGSSSVCDCSLSVIRLRKHQLQ